MDNRAAGVTISSRTLQLHSDDAGGLQSDKLVSPNQTGSLQQLTTYRRRLGLHYHADNATKLLGDWPIALRHPDATNAAASKPANPATHACINGCVKGAADGWRCWPREREDGCVTRGLIGGVDAATSHTLRYQIASIHTPVSPPQCTTPLKPTTACIIRIYTRRAGAVP